jgi:beta-galactosidase
MKTIKNLPTLPRTLDNALFHGAAWYPELWRDRMDEDLRLMRAAGINLVRVAEFAWSSLEPAPGRYDWAWLDEAFAKCQAAGIAVILGTPSCTPPLWLTRWYPETLRVDVDGRPFGHGSRGHASHVSPVYRREVARIVGALAKRYGRQPGLVAWQIDNELMGDVDGDYSPLAAKAWHRFLRDRYGTIAELNRRWATAVWSETYGAFNQVPMLGKTPFGCWTGQAVGTHHDSLATDWGDFLSRTVSEFAAAQATVIRRHSAAPILHNAIAPNRVLTEDMFAELDLAAADIYRPVERIWTAAEHLDLLRGIKRGADGAPRPFLIAETSCGQAGGAGGVHPRGFLAAEAALMLGLGGHAFCYWLWRQQRSGIETTHGSVITAWGTPSFAWDEVVKTGQLIAGLESFLTELSPAPADLAIFRTRRSQCYWQRTKEHGNLHRIGELLHQEIYRPLLELGIWRDHCTQDDDPSRYRVVLSPFQALLPAGFVQRMEAWVRAGGTWVAGPMTGFRTDDATVPTDAGLGRLDELAGMRTLWTLGLNDVRGDFAGIAEPVPLSGYVAGMEPRAADCVVLGRWLEGPVAGAPWAVQRPVGKGRLVVLGALPVGGFGRVLEALGLPARVRRYPGSWGTMVIPRGAQHEGLLAVNWDGRGGRFDLPWPATEARAQTRYAAGEVSLQPFQVLALRRATAKRRPAERRNRV